VGRQVLTKLISRRPGRKGGEKPFGPTCVGNPCLAWEGRKFCDKMGERRLWGEDMDPGVPGPVGDLGVERRLGQWQTYLLG